MRCVGLALSVLIIALQGTVPAAQSGKKPLSIETIYGGGLSRPAPSEKRWTPDGHVSFFLWEDEDEDGRNLWLFDTDSGQKRVLVSAEALRRMAPSATQATTDERERTRRLRFHVPDYHWSSGREVDPFRQCRSNHSLRHCTRGAHSAGTVEERRARPEVLSGR